MFCINWFYALNIFLGKTIYICFKSSFWNKFHKNSRKNPNYKVFLVKLLSLWLHFTLRESRHRKFKGFVRNVIFYKNSERLFICLTSLIIQVLTLQRCYGFHLYNNFVIFAEIICAKKDIPRKRKNILVIFG